MEIRLESEREREEKVPGVKHANGAISADGGEEIGGSRVEGDVVDLFVVRDQLRRRLAALVSKKSEL